MATGWSASEKLSIRAPRTRPGPEPERQLRYRETGHFDQVVTSLVLPEAEIAIFYTLYNCSLKDLDEG